MLAVLLQAPKTLISNSGGQYCRLTLDETDIIQSVVVCAAKGDTQLPSTLLLPLVGLPMTYLHTLLQRNEAGSTTDLHEYLTQPWTGLLYHDQFPELRTALVQGLVGQGGLLQGLHGESEAAVMHVQNDVMDFVQLEGAAEFPQYDVSAITR